MTTNSISFDRAANYYDQTRQLSEPMATQGLQLILDRAGPQARILEVGAGTGRIGAPGCNTVRTGSAAIFRSR